MAPFLVQYVMDLLFPLPFMGISVACEFPYPFCLRNERRGTRAVNVFGGQESSAQEDERRR